MLRMRNGFAPIALLLCATLGLCLTTNAEIIALKLLDGQYRRVDDTIFVFLGSTITVSAHPAKDEVALPGDQYTWSGQGLNRTNAVEVTVTLTNASMSLTNFQTIAVKGRSQAVIRVIVVVPEVKVTPDHDFPGRSKDQFGVGEILHVSVLTRPLVSPIKAQLWQAPMGVFAKWVQDGEGSLVNHGDGSGTFFHMRVAWPLNSKWGKPSGMNQELEADFKLLDESVRKRNLAELVKLSGPISMKWLNRDRAVALTFLQSLSAVLSSYDFGTVDQFHSSQKVARLALFDPDKLTVSQEADLLYHLTWNLEFDFGTLSGAAWAEERQKRARQWLRCWKRFPMELQRLTVEAAMPIEPFPIFDILKKQGTVVAVFNGQPPAAELVKDPAERAKYEEHLTRQRRVQEAGNEKHSLQQDMEFFVKIATQYLAKSYATPPARDAEIERLLKEHALTEKERMDVSAELVKRRAQAVAIGEK